MSARCAALTGRPMTIDALLTERAVLGERVALADDRQVITYAELDRRSAAIAADLQRRFAPGERIACRFAVGVDAAVAMLAVVRAGLVWVGLSTALTEAETQAVLDHSDAAATFDSDHPLPALAGDPSAAPLLDRGRSNNPYRAAVISYTSGSSGTPKGVVHSQYNILLPAWSAVERGEAGGVTGVYLPLSSVNMQILGPLTAVAGGGRCQIIPTTSPGEIAERVRRWTIESLPLAAPTVIDWLSTDVDPALLASLRNPVVGGSGAPAWLFEAYRRRIGRSLTLGYGLTEAPTSVTRHQRGILRLGSSGQPLAHLQVSIVDADGRPVPDGDIGEITVAARGEGPWASAWQPMLGYWGDRQRAELACRNGRLFTGDRGRLEDGSLFVDGRLDDLIIRGGSNISAEEVATVILGVAGVNDAVVVPRSDPRLGQVPVAVVAGRVSVAEIDAACRQRLAAFKRPAQVIVVERVPRTSTGKPRRDILDALVTGQRQRQGQA